MSVLDDADAWDIVHALADTDPWRTAGDGTYCVHCRVRDSGRNWEAHQIDCLWLRAAKTSRDVVGQDQP